mgnify:CR=1 FL=1
MNISMIIGWVVAIGLVIFGIMNGGDLMNFVDIPSLAITVGGTLGGLIASFPISMLKDVGKWFKMALFPPKYEPEKYIDELVGYAKVARSQGLLQLEDSANKAKDPFMRKALMLIVDANDAEKVREMLEEAIDYTEERHSSARAFFEKGVALGPAFGMLGTLVGLVNMLKTMDTNPGSLGASMAVALVTTFYGSFLANIVFAPLEHALKITNDKEILCMQIITSGVLAIAAGSNPALIREKLEFMLPKSVTDKKQQQENNG